MPVGKKVAIMGGRMHGCQTAEFLTGRGRKVTILDTGAEEVIAEGVVFPLLKISLLTWLEEKGVEILTGVKYEEVTDKGLTIITKEGERQTIEADTIVPAMSLAPNTELIKALEGKVPEIYAIGDCSEPRLWNCETQRTCFE